MPTLNSVDQGAADRLGVLVDWELVDHQCPHRLIHRLFVVFF